MQCPDCKQLRHDGACPPRFFIDHGMIHDRVTGRHITTLPDDEFWAGMTITETCEFLNELANGN
jgi:hypothetical protein